MVKEVSQSSFKDEVSSGESLTVIDFWASWCGPCKALGPIIEELSNEYDGKVKFLKVNVDNNPVLVKTYKIFTVPTVLIVRDGQTVDTVVGFRPKNELKNLINKNL